MDWSTWTGCLQCGDRGRETRHRDVRICDNTGCRIDKYDQQSRDCDSYCRVGTVAGLGRCDCPPHLYPPCCTHSKY